MALANSEAIILRTFPIGEQDKMVVFLTPETGLYKGVAKGARKFGNRFGSSLEPLSYVKVFYYEKEHRELVTISDCDLIESFFEMQKTPDISFTLSYFSELIEEFFPSRSRDPVLFRLLLSVLRAVRSGGDSAFCGAYFEAWLLKISGILPDFHNCRKCGKGIKGNSWLSARKDGVLCSRCSEQKNEKDKIPGKLTGFLSWIKTNPPPNSPQTIPQVLSGIEPVRKIFQSILVYHMEKEPKTLRFLKN